MQVLNLKVDNMQANLNAKMKHLVNMFNQCLNVENKAECSLTDEKSQLEYQDKVILCSSNKLYN